MSPGDRSHWPDTVFFLSDYGTRDEFVGVVHAVLRRLAPHAEVIDLTHEIPPFDPRAGAATLARALPSLGPGVVLAVVDPGVGGPRRAVAVELAADPATNPAAGPTDAAASSGGPRWFVAPDNGLLTPALVSRRGVATAVTLVARRPSMSGPRQPAVTFDGRDLFAPAVADLCNGVGVPALGERVDPSVLTRFPEPEAVLVTGPGGRHRLSVEVTWVDRFGNVQLGIRGDMVPASIGAVHVGAEGCDPDAVTARRVRTFSDLGSGQPGFLADANGHLALVVNRGSAAELLGVATGSVLQLVW